MPSLAVAIEHWPIAGTFRISRGARTEAVVVTARITDGDHAGRGECVPYPRYGESPEGVAAAVEARADAIAGGMDRVALQTEMPAGAARFALDAALWDLEAKRAGKRAWELAGAPAPTGIVTAYTLGIGAIEEMAANAKRNAHRPLLKLKLAGEGDLDRVAAVRANAPDSRIVVDANEAWRPEQYEAFLSNFQSLRVSMIEQPFPADADGALADLPRPIPVCADESCHDRKTLDRLVGLYDMINIKLDKTGGLTEALALKAEAETKGLKTMVGCMVGTSLAMAPATVIATGADIADLDGPLILAQDRDHGLAFDGSAISPPTPDLWG